MTKGTLALMLAGLFLGAPVGPSCTITHLITGSTLPPAPSRSETCLSSFGEDGSYARATSVRYGAGVVTPWGRPLFFSDVTAEWNNTSASAPTTRSYLNAAAETYYLRDTVNFSNSGSNREVSGFFSSPLPLRNGSGTMSAFLDFDGDGRPDLLSIDSNTCPDNLTVRLNKNVGGSPDFNTVYCATLPPGLITDMEWWGAPGARAIELFDNGGLDIAHLSANYLTSTSGVVTNGCPAGKSCTADVWNVNHATSQYMALMDMNGDGVLDYVVSMGGDFHVYLGYRTATGFSFKESAVWTPTQQFCQAGTNPGLPDGGPPAPTSSSQVCNIAMYQTSPTSIARPIRRTFLRYGCNGGSVAVTEQLTDLNGDGLPDYLISPIQTPEPSCDNTATFSPWAVSYNTGRGFAGHPASYYGFDTGYHTVYEPLTRFARMVGPSAGVGTQTPGQLLAGGFSPVTLFPALYTTTSTVWGNQTEITKSFDMDVNGDGKPDRITWNDQAATLGPRPCEISVRINQGSRFGDPVCVAGTDLEGPLNATFALNGGRLDETPVVVGSCGSDGVCSAGCPQLPNYLCGVEPYRRPTGVNSTMIDLDGDGNPDLVRVNPLTHRFGWHRGGAPVGVDPVSGGAAPLPRPDTLTSISYLGGKQITIKYNSSLAIAGTQPDAGHVRQLVAQTTLSGPGLQPLVTDFDYSTNRTLPSLDEPTRLESFGFAESWARDSGTGLVSHQVWGGTHALNNIALIAEEGALADASAPHPLRTAVPYHILKHAYAATPTPGAGGACIPDANIQPGWQNSYVVFLAFNSEAHSDSGVTLASTRTVTCFDVDAAGHALRAAVVADSAAPTLVRFDRTLYPDPAVAPVPDCLQEVWATDGIKQLYHKYFVQDSASTCSVVREDDLAATGVVEQSEQDTYYSNGNKQTTKHSYSGTFINNGSMTVTRTLTYDPAGIAVIADITNDGTTSLESDTVIDPVTGLTTSVAGPFVTGQPGTGPQRFYLYDALYRSSVVSRTAVDQPLTAFEYVPATASAPGAVRIYSYVASAASLPAPAKNPPATYLVNNDDAILVVGYQDAQGRTVQSRKRLGTGVPASASAAVSFGLNGTVWQVDAQILDSSGRDVHHVEPYYAATGAFWDYQTLGLAAEPGAKRVQSKSYDSQARPICTISHIISGATVPSAPLTAETCVSSFAEDAFYARATSMRYGAGVVTPWGRPFFYTDVTAEWNNTSPSAPTTRNYLNAAAEIFYVRDSYGNFQETIRDVLDRTTAVIRWAGSPIDGTPNIEFTTSYDLRGRVLREDDYSSGSKLYTYLPTGEQVQVEHVPLNADASSPQATYERKIIGSLGRVVKHRYIKLVPTPGNASCGTVQEQQDEEITLQYDLPYAGGGYTYTAGQMTFQTNTVSTIAYGYTYTGQVMQRDEWVIGLVGPVTVGRAYRQDGTVTGTAVAGVGLLDPVVYNATYDSVGHAAKLSSASPAVSFWETPAADPAHGDYDAVGHLATEYADNKALRTDHGYYPYSNQPQTYRVAPSSGGAAFWDSSAYGWMAAKLTGYTLKGQYESPSGTTYAVTYDDDGRLATAKANPGANPGPASQNFYEEFSFFTDGRKTCATGQKCRSLWNLQRVATGTVDASGNPQGSVVNQYEYHPVALDRVVQIAHSNATAPDAFQYDDRGRGAIVSRMAGSTGTTPATAVPTTPLEQYTYDALGRLRTIAVNGVPQEKLTYDAEGLLAKREFQSGASGADTARYYIDKDLTVVQRPTATLAYAHVILAKHRVASVYVPSLHATGQPIYYHRDRLGSVVGSSTAGAVAGTAVRYDFYGKVTTAVGLGSDASASELGYSGGLNLSAGLVHLQARQYSPAYRKFLEADTVDPLRYTYVRGDPANAIDPSGRTLNLLDVAFITFDAVNFAMNPSWENAGWLAASVAMAVIPGATEVRAAVKAVQASEKLVEGAHVLRAVGAGEKAAKATVEIATKTAEVAEHGVEVAGKTAEAAEHVAEGGAKAAEGAGKAGAKESTAAAHEAAGEAKACTGGSCGGSGTCFVAGTPVATSRGPISIERIELGNRVEAGEPECDGDHLAKDGQTIELQMPNPTQPADLISIRMVRPIAWLGGSQVGGQVWVDLEELSLHGAAKVSAIGPLPSEQEGAGCLVTMTVTHVASQVMELSFKETTETITLTPVHPLYVDGKGWTQAVDIKPGQTIRTTSGSLTLRASSLIEDEATRVYNFEVSRAHQYRVGNVGIWAHNGCGEAAGGSGAQGGGNGRGGEKLRPNPKADGPHSTWGRNADGKVTHHAEWKPNAKHPDGFDMVQRVDTQYAKPHIDRGQPTPHVHVKGTKGARPAAPDELPK